MSRYFVFKNSALPDVAREPINKTPATKSTRRAATTLPTALRDFDEAFMRFTPKLENRLVSGSAAPVAAGKSQATTALLNYTYTPMSRNSPT
jgi:hypothetical protein